MLVDGPSFYVSIEAIHPANTERSPKYEHTNMLSKDSHFITNYWILRYMLCDRNPANKGGYLI